MGFKTKLDYSNNRQIKQHPETLTALSGGTSFGLTFADLTKGPNIETSGVTESYTFVASTFSGNATTTIYTWYDPRMSIGEPYLSALTPSNSAETQTVLPVFQSSATIVIDGNVVNTAFTGVTFDITGLFMLDLGGGNYSGTVESEIFDVLSADTAEYTGRTIWVDSSGITRTERLIVTNNPTIGNVLTCIDSEGMASWEPATGSSGTDTYVTGGTYSSGTAVFTNNTGGTFNVTGFSTGGSGSTSYWSAGTGTNAIATINTGNNASGDNSVAQGYFTIASGNTSYAEGIQTIAGGGGSHAEGGQTQSMSNFTHAEGYRSKALWQYSHAEGRDTITNGEAAHAEGNSTQAIGNYSHSEGYFTQAIGWQSHAGGSNTIASADSSHAGGDYTIANGFCSLVHGSDSVVNGNYSIVLGRNITGNTADTTYVDNLNIKSIPTGTPVNNLGFDANGNVIVGTTGGGTNYWSAGTGTNAIATINGNNVASGDYSIAMGSGTTAQGLYSHAEGIGTLALGISSHAEGYFTIASDEYSHAEGAFTTANGEYSHVEGRYSIASGYSSHAEGYQTQANGDSAHAEGNNTLASGSYSHAEGSGSTASGFGSHGEGYDTLASGQFSHSEGQNTISSGISSHAEGWFSIASGDYSHAQGKSTQSIGSYSHAEGQDTIALGTSSHVGGIESQANGITSFVHGSGSTANGDFSIVLGRGITGNTADTTYVDNLNIKTVGSSAFLNDIRIDASGNLTTNTSDIRLKENINTISSALDKVMNLRGVTYNWKDRLAGGDSLKLGFIAQEVQDVVSELVFTNKNDGYMGIHIDGIIPLLVQAIKELISGNTQYSKTYLETQTILAEDNNIELNYNGSIESSIGGGITIIRGEEESTNLSLDENGNWISNVNIFSKGFVIPEYTPTNTQDTSGIIGNIVQDDDYIYIKRQGGWKRTPKLEEF